ncbi:transcription elongation factor S-II family protein [Rhizodiscina lignyota]|uniref:Transcription elongation factor n=1 Tax=Rhizodiscina lignyota TaxID=1504668 RepID=A0A9P4M9F4_9PEZI|nr:transcription elongation factor S-II family protein [Rhizodiscina lignyota]
MDAKEIVLKGKDITKAFAGGDKPDSLLALLDDLRKGVKASEEILRSTKIGITVNRLRAHKDPNVSRQAAELVAKWRTDVKNASGGSGSSTPKVQNGLSSPAPSPAPPKPKAKHSVPPEKRNAKADKVDINVTGNPTRDNCLKLMYDGLAFMSEDMPDEVMRVARDVELAAFNKFQPESSPEYKNKIRSLYQNLKNKTNPELRKRVLSGEIIATRFVVMSHEELMSPARREEDKKLMKENMDKAMVAQEEKSVSTSLQCGKCGQKKVSYTQAQTRSADEPMTTFCECLNCGRRWKFS